MVRRVASPYNVNAAALAVLPRLCEIRSTSAAMSRKYSSNRDRLQHELGNLGLHYWSSHANFVLARIGSAHASSCKPCVIAEFWCVTGTPIQAAKVCVRLTVGADEHTETLIAALRDVAEQLGLRARPQSEVRA